MKINIEYTEEEYKSLMKLGYRVMDSIDKMVVNKSSKRRSGIASEILHDIINEGDSFEEDSSEETEEKPLHFVKDGIGKDQSIYVTRGATIFFNLVDMWKDNFNGEGEQPNRADIILKLRDSYDGRALLHYLESMKQKSQGLTYAVRDTKLTTAENIRLIAENIAQVTSALSFSQIASYLEHPNPTQLEDFFYV